MAENRVTRELLQVLSDGPSNARVTRELLQVLSDGPSNARVTRLLLQVLWVEISDPDLTDDLNSWSDNVTAGYEHYNLDLASDANSWDDFVSPLDYLTQLLADDFAFSDTVATDYYAPSTPITQDVASNFSEKIKAVRYHFTDGIETQVLPFGDIDFAVDDISTFFADELELETGHEFAESFTLTDAIEAWNGLVALLYDTLYYHLGDALDVSTFESIIEQNLTDVFTLTDLVEAINRILKELSDAFDLTDLLSLSKYDFGTNEDDFTISDGTDLVLDAFLSLDDSIALSDVVTNDFIQDETKDLASSFSLTDTNDTVVATSDLIYIRRHLEDLYD